MTGEVLVHEDVVAVDEVEEISVLPDEVFEEANVSIAGNVAQWVLQDNMPGDDTLDPNIIIDDFAVAIATPPVPAPALAPWGIGAAVLVLIGVAFRAARRRRRL